IHPAGRREGGRKLMWFEPLFEVGALLACCAVMLGAAMPLFRKPEAVAVRNGHGNRSTGGCK
ncbi:MAG: hypothetical protein AB3N24_20015, partial [Leisingera sp.]